MSDELQVVDDRLNMAFDELESMVAKYRAEAFKNETPFTSHMMPSRIKLRLKLIEDIGRDRSDAWRKVYRTREEITQAGSDAE